MKTKLFSEKKSQMDRVEVSGKDWNYGTHYQNSFQT